MHIELTARVASVEEDEDTFVLAFADDAENPATYLMLQYPLDVDEQDVRLGLDGLYIERDDQSMGCYRGVSAVRRAGEHIEIVLTDSGRRRLQAERITVTVVPWQPALDDGLARLAELTRGEVIVTFAQPRGGSVRASWTGR